MDPTFKEDLQTTQIIQHELASSNSQDSQTEEVKYHFVLKECKTLTFL